MTENQSTVISVESMRKNLLTLLLKRKDITVVETNTLMTKEIVCDEHSSCLYDMQLPILIESGFALPEEDLSPRLLNDTLKTALNDLVDLELSKIEAGKASIRDENHTTLLDTVVYQITPKGLDVALKLQEHEDNERRFEQQKGISKELKKNSDRSVLTARVALVLSVVLVCFGGYRVYQLEQKILSHSIMEARMNTTDLELGKLRDKNDLLVKELEAFKNKPVTTVVVKVDDTHQTKKKER
jgi:hypothetical protein